MGAITKDPPGTGRGDAPAAQGRLSKHSPRPRRRRRRVPAASLPSPSLVLLAVTAMMAGDRSVAAKHPCHQRSSRFPLSKSRVFSCDMGGTFLGGRLDAPSHHHDAWFGFQPRFGLCAIDRGAREGFPPALSVLRGGGTEEQLHTSEYQSAAEPPMESKRATPLSGLPLIDVETVALALRLTCETNRRLRRGAFLGGKGALETNKNSDASAVAAGAANTDALSLQRHHEHSGAQMQQTVSTAMPPAIRSLSYEALLKERREEEMTVFHTAHPWEPTGVNKLGNVTDSRAETTGEQNDMMPQKRTGSSRWGPELQTYLNALLSSLRIHEKDSASDSNDLSPMEDEAQLILTLTILYLDRSASPDAPPHVDPVTGRPWCPPCPHLRPRTVHRTVLAAMAIAAKCVRGEGTVTHTLREAANANFGTEEHALSESEMDQMEDWMLHALGSGGGAGHHHHHHNGASWQASHEEIGTFLRKWGETFYPTRLAAQDQSRMRQQERFWNDQTAALGGPGQHGHGNYPHNPAPLQYSSIDYPSVDGQGHPYPTDHPPQQQYYETLGSEPF